MWSVYVFMLLFYLLWPSIAALVFAIACRSHRLLLSLYGTS